MYSVFTVKGIAYSLGLSLLLLIESNQFAKPLQAVNADDCSDPVPNCLRPICFIGEAKKCACFSCKTDKNMPPEIFCTKDKPIRDKYMDLSLQEGEKCPKTRKPKVGY